MKEFLSYQYKNLFLWMPFVMAFGAALYFSLGTEPIFNFPIIITILLGAIFFRYKNILIKALCVFFFGFFYAMSFTHIVDTPQIRDSFGEKQIFGIIKDIDYSTDKTRIVMRVPMEQIKQDDSHKYVNIRISLPDKNENFNIGDTIKGDAVFFHPSGKYINDSFDFARWAYFSKLSATGFFKDYEIVKQNTTRHFRTYIHEHANSFLTDSLVLGYKKMLPKNESDIWKTVGVGHVWSISGFHMTLVGGWLFALFYLIFRCIPKITKRVPAKYPALACAWVGLLFYLFLSGISVATTRAFLMATLIGIATLFGRSIFSLRNGVLAFLIIFLINPFFVMNAGFQLSFAAIFGLLWFFQDKKYVKRDKLQKISHNVYMSLMTAVVATLFTLPFIIAHFGYIPIYSLIGNLIILPIFSIIIMPLIMVGTLLALFGYHYLIHITHNIYNFALDIATYIANLPHANFETPFIPNSALLLSMLGFLFLILIVRPPVKNNFIKNINYILCFCCVFIAILICTTREKPLVYSTSDNELVGFVVNNKLQFNKAKYSKHYFAFDSWYEFNNQPKPDKNTRFKCEHGLCIYKTQNWNLIYMKDFTTVFNNLETLCSDKSVKFIVTTFETRIQNCHATVLGGGFVIYPNGKIVKVRNQRPWHNTPKQNTTQMRAQ